MTADEIDEMGYLDGDTPSRPLRELAAMARLNASNYQHDSREFRSWIALSGRCEHAARHADTNAREIHGFEGDDT